MKSRDLQVHYVRCCLYITSWKSELMSTQIDGLTLDCSNSNVLALELRQSCALAIEMFYTNHMYMRNQYYKE